MIAWELIHTILELKDMVGDELSQWRPQNFEDNPPRLLRLQIVDALSNLVLSDVHPNSSIETRVDSILKGDFIRHRKLEDYSSVFEEMDGLTAKSKEFGHLRKHEIEKKSELRFNYKRLLKFKTLAMPLLNFHSGTMAGPYSYFSVVILTQDIIRQLNLRKIDELICKIIDPWNRSFSREQLTEMGYPSESLCVVDDDWL
jgi:hypothetical protein